MINFDSEKWRQARQMFQSALERPEEDRQAFLAGACQDDGELLASVRRMLAQDAMDEGLLDHPALPAVAQSAGASAETHHVPRQIGRYRITGIASSGGMGIVYEALQGEPQRKVAVKVMRGGLTSHEAQRRFQYESEILGRLAHPGIAQIFEAGTYQDADATLPFFAMEYVVGARTITEYAREKKLNNREKLKFFLQVCDAVHHGHQNGVIHRDLKPSNILVSSEGFPKIIDFGVARSTDPSAAAKTLQTATGQLLGTLQYMSPEQCEGNPHDVDTRSDVYSLGVVLYELLCDQLPYDVSNVALSEATRRVREMPPARLSTINAQLRGDVETIVTKALEKQPDRRYTSAAELASDIQRYLAGEAIMARPPSVAYLLRVFARRHKALVVGAVAVVIALTLGIIGTSLGLAQANRQREAALDARDESAAVTEFLIDTLGAASSHHERGPNATLREVLDDAAQQLDRSETFAAQPRVKATLHTAIGKAYMSLATYHADAEKHLRKALKIRRDVFGTSHRKVADSLHNLAIAIWWKEGVGETVESLLRESLAIRQEILGDEAPATLQSLHDLALFRRDYHFDIENQRLFRQVLASRRKVLGSQHLDVAETLNELAVSLCWSVRLDEAEPLLREALQIRRQQLGDGHILVASTMATLGNLQHDLRNNDEAEQLLRDALTIQRDKYPGDHGSIAHTVFNLARLLVDNGQLVEAEKLLHEAIKRYGALGQRGDFAVARCRVYLGECLAKKGQFSDGEETLLAALVPLNASNNHHQHFVQLAREQLVALYEAWDKPDEAALWRAKLVDGDKAQE